MENFEKKKEIINNQIMSRNMNIIKKLYEKN